MIEVTILAFLIMTVGAYEAHEEKVEMLRHPKPLDAGRRTYVFGWPNTLVGSARSERNHR
jgi:hypothetical protein